VNPLQQQLSDYGMDCDARRCRLAQSAMTVEQLRREIAGMDPKTLIWIVGDDLATLPLQSVGVGRDGVLLVAHAPA